jgi:hypothetical protein
METRRYRKRKTPLEYKEMLCLMERIAKSETVDMVKPLMDTEIAELLCRDFGVVHLTRIPEYRKMLGIESYWIRWRKWKESQTAASNISSNEEPEGGQKRDLADD